MYKYLLWDIDGTVLDFVASEKYAIQTLFSKYNLGECTDEMLQTYSKINRKYWELLERKEMTKPEILVGRFQEFFQVIGIDTALAERFNKEYQVTLGDCIVFSEYAEELLQAQKTKYILLAVTNGTKIAQTKKLKNSGLDKIFHRIYISEDVGFEKPSMEYFQHVFDKEGIVNKKEVLIIGDSLTSDIQGGINAGIDTCWYNPNCTEKTVDLPVTYEIDSLDKLTFILNQNA